MSKINQPQALATPATPDRSALLAVFSDWQTEHEQRLAALQPLGPAKLKKKLDKQTVVLELWEKDWASVPAEIISAVESIEQAYGADEARLAREKFLELKQEEIRQIGELMAEKADKGLEKKIASIDKLLSRFLSDYKKADQARRLKIDGMDLAALKNSRQHQAEKIAELQTDFWASKQLLADMQKLRGMVLELYNDPSDVVALEQMFLRELEDTLAYIDAKILEKEEELRQAAVQPNLPEKTIRERAMAKALERWQYYERETIDGLDDKDDKALRKKIKDLKKEIDAINRGEVPKNIQKLLDGLTPTEAERMRNEYALIRENILYAAEAIQAEREGSSKTEVVKKDYREDNEEEVEAMGDLVRTKVAEWRSAAEAFLQSLEGQDAETIETELARYAKANGVMRGAWNAEKILRTSALDYDKQAIGGAKSTEAGDYDKVIDEILIQDPFTEIPADVLDFINRLPLDDLAKDKLRDEYLKIREDVLRGGQAMLINKQEGKDDEAISVERDEASQLAEAQAEIDNLSPEEKKGFFEGLADLGYWTSLVRSQGMGKVMSSLAKLSSKSDRVGRFFQAYTDIYAEDAAKAQAAIDNKDKGAKAKMIGTAQGFGNVMKYGRIVYDAADSFNLRGLNPFRHVTAGAMFIGRSSEAAKRAILNGEAIKEKTRIEDVGEAQLEAMRTFGIDLMAEGTTYLSGRELKERYQAQLPADILARIERGGALDGSGWYRYLFERDAKGKVERVTGKLEKIEKSKKLSVTEKEEKKALVMKKYSRLLADLDRMMTHQGAVDNFAYTAQIAETLGKTTANLLIIDSLARLVRGVAESDLFDRAWHEGGEASKKYAELIREKYAEELIEPLRPAETAVTGGAAGSLAEQAAEAEKRLEKALEKADLRQAEDPQVSAEMNQKTTSFNQYEDKARGQFNLKESNLGKATNVPPLADNAPKTGGEIPAEQLHLATIQSGPGANSIEGVFIRQLRAAPEKYGFSGDLDDKAEIRAWAGKLAHKIAIDNGYFDQTSQQGIRMKGSSIDHNAYVIRPEGDKFGVDEFVNGNLRESKRPGAVFEAGTTENNEYVADERTGRVIRPEPAPAPRRREYLQLEEDDNKKDIPATPAPSPVAARPTPLVPDVEPAAKAATPVVEPAIADTAPIRPASATAISGGSEASAVVADGPMSEDSEKEPALSSDLVEKKYEVYRNLYKLDKTTLNQAGVYLEDGMSEEESRKIAQMRGRVEHAPSQNTIRPETAPARDQVQEFVSGRAAPVAESLQTDRFSALKEKYNISDELLEKAGISGRDEEAEKGLALLIKHQGNQEQAIEVVKLSKELGQEPQALWDYYFQLKDLSGQPDRQLGLLEVLNRGNNKEGYALVFGINILDEKINIEGNKVTIKDVAPGYDIVAVNEAKEIKFGVKGPLGKNWTADGQSAFMRVDIPLDNEHIDRALAEIKKMSGRTEL